LQVQLVHSRSNAVSKQGMPAFDVSVAKCLITLTTSCAARSFVWDGCNKTARRNLVFRTVQNATQAF